MDVSKWTKKQIMQLPDHFFGRHWWTGTRLQIETGVAGLAIAEERLPEYCILWQVYATATYTGATVRTTLDLRLGTKLPANDAEFDTFERLIPGIGLVTGREPLYLNQWSPIYLVNQRILVHAKGRRLVVRILNITGRTVWYTINVLVSSLPTDIPDELLHPPLDVTEDYLKKIWQRIKL